MSSAIGPWLFGMLISALAGQYWGGFAFLAVLNAIGAIAYFTLYVLSAKVRRTQEARTVEMHPAGGGPVRQARVRRPWTAIERSAVGLYAGRQESRWKSPARPGLA